MQSIATRKKPSRAHILTAVIIAAVYALVFAAEQLLPASSMPVSYTHLTLPTTLNV